MAAEILPILIGATLTGSAAIMALLIARGTVRRLFGAAAAYACWLLVPATVAASLLPARAPGALPLEPAAWQPAAETAIVTAVDWVATQAPAFAEGPAFDWTPAALGVWALGALACAAFLLVVQRRTVRRFGELTEDEAGGVPVLRASTVEAGPAVIGGLRPKLVIPYDFESRYGAAEQTLVLAHEQAHMRFRDPLVNGLIALLRCLNWFNPLVHIGAVMARVDQELACGAAVLARHPGERRSYAEALLKSQLAPASSRSAATGRCGPTDF